MKKIDGFKHDNLENRKDTHIGRKFGKSDYSNSDESKHMPHHEMVDSHFKHKEMLD